jgi:hypothetical protein
MSCSIAGLMNDAAEASMERRTARATLITDIENRLQFNTFVSIFFRHASLQLLSAVG